MRTKKVHFCGRNLEVLHETDLSMYRADFTEAEKDEFVAWGMENKHGGIRYSWHPLTQDAIIRANRAMQENGESDYMVFEVVDSVYVQWLQGKRPGEGSFLVSLMETYTKADGTNRAKLEQAYPEYFI